jgi:glycine C-acetyltransferase
MYKTLQPILQKELEEIEKAGLYKRERVIITPQGADIKIQGGQEVINFCANNYLGLASHPEVIEAAKKALESHGFGMASVRFICGTQDIHKELEEKISKFWVQKIPFYMQQLLMRMEVYLSLCLMSRTLLFQTH